MKLKHFIFFVLLGVVLTTCKKFPEDEFISLNTVKDRLKGNWKFESIKYHGNNITQTYNDSIAPYFIDDMVLNFSFGRTSTVNNQKVNDLSIRPAYGVMYFSISKTNIFFRKNSALNTLNSIFLSSESFSIKKLYRGKFKIQNSKYEINLRKINSR